MGLMKEIEDHRKELIFENIRLRECLRKLRSFRGVYLHDAECFSIRGDKLCVCGREALVDEIDSLRGSIVLGASPAMDR